MNAKRFYAGLTGVVLAGGLAACGSATVPSIVPRSAATATPTVTVTPMPTPGKTKTVVAVPARTVYAPPRPRSRTAAACWRGRTPAARLR